MSQLCDLDRKDIERLRRQIMRQVDRPRYLCLKCARAANELERVCKPERIPSREKQC